MWDAWCAVNSPQFTAITIAFGFLVAGIGVLCLIYIWAYFNKGSAAQQYTPPAHAVMAQQPSTAAAPAQNQVYAQQGQYGAGQYQYAAAFNAQTQQYAHGYYAATQQYAAQQQSPIYGYYANQNSGAPAIFGRPRSDGEEFEPQVLEAANSSAYWR